MQNYTKNKTYKVNSKYKPNKKDKTYKCIVIISQLRHKKILKIRHIVTKIYNNHKLAEIQNHIKNKADKVNSNHKPDAKVHKVNSISQKTR